MRNVIAAMFALSLGIAPRLVWAAADAQPPAFASAEEASRALKGSFDLWRSGRVEEAIALGEGVVAYDPGLRYQSRTEKVGLLASLQLAMMYADKGEIERAEHYAVVAQRYAPRGAGPRIILAWAMRERQRRGLPARSLGTGGDPAAPLVVASGCGCALPVEPILRDGNTLSPLRVFCEARGATVTWDEATQSATASLGDKSITFTLGRAVASVQCPVAGPTTNNEQLTTQEIALRVAPYLNEEGRMMVPLRPLVEALGGTVKWEPEAQIVYVNLPAAASGQPPEEETEGTDDEAAG